MSQHDHTLEHQELLDDLLLAVGSLPYIRCWPSRVGLAVPIGRTKPVHYGQRGESDIEGILRISLRSGLRLGIYLSIEVKTGTGRLEVPQQRWQDMVNRLDGLHIVAKSVEQVLTEIMAFVIKVQGTETR